MTSDNKHITTQLAVIGSGMAGFAASLFAINKGISTTQVGDTGAMAYTSGYFDLLGTRGGDFAVDPFEALDYLQTHNPNHILSRIASDDIATAFAEFTAAVSSFGVGYSEPVGVNHLALLPVGSVKPTYSVPLTMLPGIKARERGAKALIVDIVGLQGFSSAEFVANMGQDWPQLSSGRLAFPDMESGAQAYPEVMARALEVPAIQEQFARRLKEVAQDAEIVGLPAIMGIHLPDRVHARIEELAGVPLFEIPTIPPGVAGIRLREMLEQKLPAKGLVLIPHQKVKKIEMSADRAVLRLKDSFGDVTIDAQTVLLATGRFLSGGLKAGRHKIIEPLLDLPVVQPEDRNSWYGEHYFDPQGHAINRTGIEVDENFRPLGADGKPIAKHLFAAGVLLAHQDWISDRCGAGVAIASAYQAVQSIQKHLQLNPLSAK